MTSTARTIANLAKTSTTVVGATIPLYAASIANDSVRDGFSNHQKFSHFESVIADYGIIKGFLEVVEGVALLAKPKITKDYPNYPENPVDFENKDHIVATMQIVTGAASICAGLLYQFAAISITALGAILALNAFVKSISIFVGQYAFVNTLEKIIKHKYPPQHRYPHEEDYSGMLNLKYNDTPNPPYYFVEGWTNIFANLLETDSFVFLAITPLLFYGWEEPDFHSANACSIGLLGTSVFSIFSLIDKVCRETIWKDNVENYQNDEGTQRAAKL